MTAAEQEFDKRTGPEMNESPPIEKLLRKANKNAFCAGWHFAIAAIFERLAQSGSIDPQTLADQIPDLME